jgi:hypothetical protein
MSATIQESVAATAVRRILVEVPQSDLVVMREKPTANCSPSSVLPSWVLPEIAHQHRSSR